MAQSPPQPLLHEDKIFYRGLFGPIKEHAVPGGGTVKTINLGAKKNILEIDTLIIRPCYEHLLPYIHNYLLADPEGPLAVTGTPGIGKTVFGVFLLRYFVVECKQTVLYWHGSTLYLFSFDEKVKTCFNLVLERTVLGPILLFTLVAGLVYPLIGSRL